MEVFNKKCLIDLFLAVRKAKPFLKIIEDRFERTDGVTLIANILTELDNVEREARNAVSKL